MPLRETCVISALLPRWPASRIAEAASRYGLSASDLAGAVLEAVATQLSDVERVMNVYGCCDRETWRFATSVLLASGSALYELVEPIIKALHGDGVLFPLRASWLEGMRGVSLRLASLDPWLDYIDVEVESGKLTVSYVLIVGGPGTTPGYRSVLESLGKALAPGVELVEEGGEARLTHSLSAERVEALKPIEEVASMYADILREAGVEWIIAEVEHGYSPERHAEIARSYYQLSLETEEVTEAAFNLLRALEETVKMLVKRHELSDILEEASKTGWTAGLLDDAVERLTGIYPILPGAWRKALEASIALQENRLTRDELRELRNRVERVLRKTGVL